MNEQQAIVGFMVITGLLVIIVYMLESILAELKKRGEK